MDISKKQATDLIDRNYRDVYIFCLSRSRNPETAKDITQDVFLLFWKKYKELSNDNIRGWLFSTAWNKMNEYFRESGKEKNYVSIDDIGEDISFEENYSEITDTTEEMLDIVQKRILGLLNDNEKNIFIRLFIKKEELTIFAEKENISVEAAGMRKNRLRKKALKLYREKFFIFLALLYN